jgi:aminoglycoside phosphotransferase (APT) family kinase protein
LTAAEREQILPLDYHLMLSPNRGAVSRLLNQSALKPCLKKQPGVMPESVQAAYRTTLKNWDRLLDHWYAGPLSLLHGDSHLGNFFVSGDEMGMLDWQAVHWGKGVRDVQYFLIDALPQELLAANERQLLNYYVERRAVHGAAIDGEEAWQDYRSFTYHTLMTIVVSIGFGALNEEQDELMSEILKRSVSAVERVDYPGWLRDFLN